MRIRAIATVLRELRHRWYVVVGLVLVLLVAVWLAHGALQDSDERRESRKRIEASANEAKDLAREVRDQGVRIEAQNARIEEQNATLVRIATAIDNATSPEAQARGAANLAGAIADLRRSTDCVGLYFNGERPAPCGEVDARLDALRSGVDPFARPTPPTGAPT